MMKRQMTKKNQMINDVDGSHEHADAISEKSLRDYFHLDKAVATPNLCENICPEDNYCDGYAFGKFEYRVPTPKQNWSGRLVATSIMVVDKVHNHESGKLLRVLFDSGGDRTMIHRSTLPKGVNPMVLDKRARMNTLAGIYESDGEVVLKGLHLQLDCPSIAARGCSSTRAVVDRFQFRDQFRKAYNQLQTVFQVKMKKK